MRFKVPLFIASLLSFANISASPANPLSFTFDTIGSFEEKANDIQITGKLSSSRGASNIKERLSIGVIGQDYTKFSTTALHSLARRQTQEVSFNLPLSTMLTSKGLKGKIEVLNSSNTALLTHTFNLLPINRKTIRIQDYVGRDYIVNDVIIKPSDYDNYHQEIISFPQYYDYFDEKVYHTLSLNRFIVNYTCFENFPGCTVNLRFTDYNRLFPYLDLPKTIPYFTIPLRARYVNGIVRFYFPNMFVNPKTLEMSLIFRAGFVATNVFYLPLNKNDLLLDQVFQLEVSEFGYGKISFRWDITYLTTKHLVGDCQDSEYCIIGEVI